MHNWRSCFVTGASFLINPHQMQSWLSTWRLGSWLLPNNCHLAVAAVYPLFLLHKSSDSNGTYIYGETDLSPLVYCRAVKKAISPQPILMDCN
ncbi:hypothetical protein [Providencia sp. PROV195]|uniref:hypothetical protein n=1 Tax=Providencia sp. PROV195 TaxID=2949896 RepID=UPI00234B549C|nr:hypothetical protein [Providencia sp. PROV195]